MKKHHWKYLVVILFALVTFGSVFFIKQPKILNETKINNEELFSLSEEYINKLITNDTETLNRMINLEHIDLESTQMLLQLDYFGRTMLKSSFPLEESQSLHGSEIFEVVTQEHQVSINNKNQYIVTWSTFSNTPKGYKISGFSFKETENSVFNIEKLNFQDHGIQILISLILNLFIIFTALFAIYKNKNVSWWMLIIILFLNLFIYLKNGQIGININIGIPGIVKRISYFTPFMFLYPIPIGTIIYWIKSIRGKNKSGLTIKT